jgi:hypothetical protein
MNKLNKPTAACVAFMGVGLAFIAIGSSGQPVYLPIGVAVVLIGVVFNVLQRRSGGLK